MLPRNNLAILLFNCVPGLETLWFSFRMNQAVKDADLLNQPPIRFLRSLKGGESSQVIAAQYFGGVAQLVRAADP
jgi:hypothetical protein